jgi:8-oxo-dGTP pyrophosphatase MutT (NUDIX family)
MNRIPIIRPAARILLVDEFDRTFLFKGQDPQNKSDIFWCPVGGGIEPGETLEEAIRREVMEETGFSDIERETTLDQKWWTFQDLAQTHESLAPRRFPELLGPLLVGHFPEKPLDLIHEESHL